MSLNSVSLDQRPRLTRAARLRYDAPTRSYVLLSPERGLRLNDCASEVLLRCNGDLTVEEICSQILSACGPQASAMGVGQIDNAARSGEANATSARHSDVTSRSGGAIPSVEQVTRDILELLVELRQRQLLFFDNVL